jgi:hypothetical protein
VQFLSGKVVLAEHWHLPVFTVVVNAAFVLSEET